jgi:hypothetical protein
VELHPKAASVPIGDADDDDELEVPIEATFIGQGVVYFFVFMSVQHNGRADCSPACFSLKFKS